MPLKQLYFPVHLQMIPKSLYLSYRTRARELYEGSDQAGLKLIVPEHAWVQPCEDGAFVEAVVWVPAMTKNETKEQA